MFFLPCLGSNSLEMSNRGFQQVPLPQFWESKTESAASLSYDPAQPEAGLLLAKTRALAPLSSSLSHLHPKVSSDMKPSHLHWAPGLGACPRNSEAGAGVFLPTSGNSVTPHLGILGSYIELAIFVLSQWLTWGPAPCSVCEQDFEVVPWTILNFDNSIVGRCFLGFLYKF